MSSNSKRQRQKKSTERIIPIQIEDDDDSKEIKKDASDSDTTASSSSKDSHGSTLSKIFDDSTTSASSDKIDLSDNTEMATLKEQDMDLKIPERMIPPYNVPEKIIIVLDRAEDEVSTPFELTNGTKLKPLDMLKDVLKFFLHMKSSFDAKHEYALMTLNENSATWVCDFTSNIRSIFEEINEIEECQTEDIFDMATVFDLINAKIKVPELKSDLIAPPPFIVRAIFLYNRSITMPQIDTTEEIQRLLESPYFTFDVAMTHETPDSSNKCNLIFKELQQLDTKGYGYFFPITRNVHMLQGAMAKLLGHPLQRCRQQDANYKFVI